MNPAKPASQAHANDAVSEALLERRFASLWRRCLIPGSQRDAAAVWAAVKRRYGESHRRYHNEQHLAHCLEQLDLVVDQVGQPDGIEMAIWFHDVVYEPGRPDNEARSADLFCSFAGDVMHSGLITAVVDLIMATTHKVASGDPSKQMICDIDLSSFGFPWPAFVQDSANLRAEFQGSVDAFCLGRRRFLEAMLQRPKIFMTNFFNNRYESQARDNIRRFLATVDE